MKYRIVVKLYIIFCVTTAVFSCTTPSQKIMPNYSNLELRNEQGSVVTFKKLAGSKGIILISHRSECPIVRKYTSVVESMREEFGAKGVAVVYFNSEDWEEPEIISKHIESYNLKTPIFHDDAYKVAKTFEMKRTSEVVFLSEDMQTIIYQGAIDDRFEYEETRPARHHFLKDAVDAHLQGRSASIRKTKSLGCLLNLD